MKRFKTIAILFLMLCSHFSNAQDFSVSTNLGDVFCLGSLNLEGSYAFSERWTVDAGADYNPWTFVTARQQQIQNRHLSVYFGPSYWFDKAFDGWSINGHIQYTRYNAGGIFSRTSEEGNAFGAGLGFGYHLPISNHIRLGLGIGFWAGVKNYTVYECTRCGRIVDNGTRFFAGPDDVMVSLCYVF